MRSGKISNKTEMSTKAGRCQLRIFLDSKYWMKLWPYPGKFIFLWKKWKNQHFHWMNHWNIKVQRISSFPIIEISMIGPTSFLWVWPDCTQDCKSSVLSTRTLRQGEALKLLLTPDFSLLDGVACYQGSSPQVRRFTSPKIHKSEGSQVRRFTSPKVHKSEDP